MSVLFWALVLLISFVLIMSCVPVMHLFADFVRETRLERTPAAFDWLMDQFVSAGQAMITLLKVTCSRELFIGKADFHCQQPPFSSTRNSVWVED